MPAAFFTCVVALWIPLWILGARPQSELRNLLPFNLPISALTALCPGVAAVALAFRAGNGRAARRLISRAWDYRRAANRWYAAALLVMPGIMLLSYAAMRALGRSLPEANLSFTDATLLIVPFVIGAFGEELGWQGYAFDPLAGRLGVRLAAVVLALFWASWHAIPFVETGHDADWVVGQTIATAGLRVIIVWLYVGAGGSVLAPIVFHAMTNVSDFMFPVNGSYYDPFVTGILVLLLAAVALRVMPRGATRRNAP